MIFSLEGSHIKENLVFFATYLFCGLFQGSYACLYFTVYVDLRLDIQVLCDGHPSKRSLFQEQLATI